MRNGTQSAERRRDPDHTNNNNVIINAMTRRSIEAPSTPDRPIFGFSVPTKSVPSKWEDAEKWLISASSYHSPPPHHLINAKRLIKGSFCKQQSVVFSHKSKLVNCQITSNVCLEENDYHHHFNGVMAPTDVPLNDKYRDKIGPITHNMKHLEPTKEAFLFKSEKHENEAMTDACTEVIPFQEVKHRDIGTEMTPLGSSTTSTCVTPFMTTSPPRHNTPASRSGPLASVDQCSPTDITKQLRECHLAKLQFGSSQFDSVTTNWSSREEEEEEISKSLRHFEVGRRSVSISESRVSVWEEEAKAESCLRYQREEAKIEAWLNLQTAKAEAQSRKLEVKIEKMRWDVEEKVMKRMWMIHRKAEERRAAAKVEHCEEISKSNKRVVKKHHKLINTHFCPHLISCACFPRTNSTN